MKIKYPNPSIKNEKIQAVKTHGMLFENALNTTNEFYRIHNKAIIYKKPTPIQVVKVDYPARSKARIIEAYYKTPSTTDYNGIYKGKYIDFEAKETISKSFSFTHIFPHQIEHLLNIKKHGGIAFVIIYYKKFNQVVIIDIDEFNQEYVEANCDGAKKSIEYERALEIGKAVKNGYTPPFDYLKVVDEMYF